MKSSFTRLGPDDTDDSLFTGEPRPPAPWRLVLAVTIPFWIYLAFMRVVVHSVITAGNPGIIIAPPHLRLLQHAFLLPMLLVFFRTALAVGWPMRGKVRAAV